MDKEKVNLSTNELIYCCEKNISEMRKYVREEFTDIEDCLKILTIFDKAFDCLIKEFNKDIFESFLFESGRNNFMIMMSNRILDIIREDYDYDEDEEKIHFINLVKKSIKYFESNIDYMMKSLTERCSSVENCIFLNDKFDSLAYTFLNNMDFLKGINDYYKGLVCLVIELGLLNISINLANRSLDIEGDDYN
jgi:hypothetical protein